MRELHKRPVAERNAPFRWLWWIGFCITVVSLAGGWWAIIECHYIYKPGLLGISIVLTGYVISERLIGLQSLMTEHQIKTEIDAARDQVVAILAHSFNMVYVGNHREGLRAVAHKLQSATRVRDTYLRMFPDRVIFGHPDIGVELYSQYMALTRRPTGHVELVISKHNLPMIRELGKALVDRI